MMNLDFRASNGDIDVDSTGDGGSFWEPGNYRRTTKRISDGYHLCNELMSMMQERGEIEAKYASQLRSWSKKWNNTIDKGLEYGTIANAWKSVLNEADRLAVLHVQMKEQMDSDVIGSVRQWQKDNYHKTIIRDFKEKKELDDAFKKAQKPWEKKLREVLKTKQDYHSACQKERTAIVREKNSIKDTSLSVDQKKKLEEDVFKLTEIKQQNREKYEKALRDLNEYNPKYLEDMTDVYDKFAEMERRRIEFIKDELKKLHTCLDLSRSKTMDHIYSEFANTVDLTDSSKDLRWWSKTYGLDMPMSWPQFEEFQPELKTISNKKSSRALAGADGIALTGVQFKTTDDEMPPVSVSVSLPTKTTSTLHTVVQNHFSALISNGSASTKTTPAPSSYHEDEWGDDNLSLADTADSGIPVCAMYDYEAVEEDELTFSRGEIFEKLEDEDDQGWCKGRKGGRVGLFPGSYVKGIQTP